MTSPSESNTKSEDILNEKVSCHLASNWRSHTTAQFFLAILLALPLLLSLPKNIPSFFSDFLLFGILMARLLIVDSGTSASPMLW